MYETIKNVIKSKDYNLSDMLMQIKKNCVRGDITEEQETELLVLARENALPENSYAGLQEQINELYTITTEHTTEINACNDEIAKLNGEVPEPPVQEEYPPYKQPTGAHDAYHKDDKITFEGQKYICIAPEGVAVVWNPADYPAYWQKVE